MYTRSQLRTFLRRRIADTETVTWSDSELNDQLNISAQAIAVSLARHAIPRYTRGTTTLTPNGTNVYPISVPDFHSLIDVTFGPTGIGAVYADEKEFNRHRANFANSNINEKGQYVYTLVYDSDDVGEFSGEFSGEFFNGNGYSIIFPYTLGESGDTAVFQVSYARLIPEIPDATSADSQTFTRIPYQHQQLIVQHAAASLLADDASPQFDTAMGKFGLMLQDGVFDSKTRATPASTK